MFDYIVRRLMAGLLTLWVITFLLMALIRNMPGDPIALQAMGADESSSSNSQATKQLMEEMRKSYGLDKPWYVGYWVWVAGLVRGDLGRSMYDHRLVTDRILERCGPTLTLSVISLTMLYLMSIPTGLYMTAKNGKWQEQVLSTLFYILYSVPNFVTALYLILIVSVRFDLLPMRGMTSDPETYAKLSTPGKAWDLFTHLLMPVFCYLYGGLAYLTRFIKANMLEVVRQDYVRTARAKGLAEPVVFFRHAFRNTLIPLVTLLGLALPGLLSGSVILERVFSWPGMGNLFLESITQRDYPVIMGLTLTFSILVQAGSLLSDILYAAVDPRVRLSVSNQTAQSEPETGATAKGPSLSFWRETWKRYKKQKRAMLGLSMLGFLSIVGLFAPFVAGTKPIICKYKGSYYFPAMSYYNDEWENSIFLSGGDRFRSAYPANLKRKDPDSWAIWPLFYADPYRKVQEKDWKDVPGFEGMVEADNRMRPCHGFVFGTDEYGRSVFARMVHGTSIALAIGFVSMGIASVIGLAIGSIAGYTGGRVDIVLSRIMEIVQSIPTLILILALIAIVEKPTIWKLMAVIGCTGWISIARLTRGEFLKLVSLDYVTAARALGFSTTRIILRHVLPNALAPALVSISFGIASAILTESGLSLLGFGVQPPTPSWGAILHAGMNDFSQWWLILFPGLAVFVAVFTYNLIGDGLQQASDPRLR